MTGSPSRGKNPPARALQSEPRLPSWLQRRDLLAAFPRQGPWQEEFKHPQEKPPAIDPHIRLPERSRAFIKEPGPQLSLSSSFLLPPKSFPRAVPPSPGSLGELGERLPAEVEGGFVCSPFPADPYQGVRPGGGAGHFGLGALEQIFGSWRNGVGT